MREGEMSGCRLLGVVLTVALLMAGCATAPPKGRSLDAQITASLDVNPDRFGVASPITVRFFQLRSDAQFRGAAFEALFDNPQLALGADVVAFEDFVLGPGERRPLGIDLRPETEFLAVAAAFQSMPQATWKDLRRAPKKSLMPDMLKGSNQLSIAVARNHVSFDGGDR
jgi:type VI secretion system protein VasD